MRRTTLGTSNFRHLRHFFFLIAAESAVIVFYITPVLTITSPGFPLDDSWIYAVFARNFVSSGEIAFNLGHPSLGFTSSLWFLFLSLGQLLGVSPVAWGILLGSIAQITLASMVGLLVYKFLSPGGDTSHRSGGMTDNSNLDEDISKGSRSGSHSPFPIPHSPKILWLLSFFASLLILLCGPLIWYSLSGMETTCFMAIGLLAIFLLSGRWYWWAGLALGFLLITRIEGIALWGIALLYAAAVEYWRETGTGRSAPSSMHLLRNFPKKLRDPEVFHIKSRDNNTRSGDLQVATNGSLKAAATRLRASRAMPYAKKLLPLVLIPSLFLILELLKNLYLTGALLPTTFAGRKWLSVPVGGRGPIAYLKLWGYGFKLTLLPKFLQENPLLIFFWISAGILTVLSIRILLKKSLADRERIAGLSLLILWVIGHNLVYMVMLPSPSQAGRYQALNFLVFWIILFLPVAVGLSRLAGKFSDRKKIFSGGGLIILLSIILLLDLGSTQKWKEIYLATVRHINDVHIKVAGWINNELPPGSRIAAFDIGALKYFSPGTEIIDLGGLVDREFAGYLQEGRVVDYMKDREVSYLAMVELQNSPGWIFENLHILDDPQLKLHPLFGMMQRPEIYRIHYRAAAITFPKMVLYKIEWNTE